METDLIRELLAKEGKELVHSWVRDIPLGRMAHPSEMQGVAVWMASDASSYLNGNDIVRLLSLISLFTSFQHLEAYFGKGEVAS